MPELQRITLGSFQLENDKKNKKIDQTDYVAMTASVTILAAVRVQGELL